MGDHEETLEVTGLPAGLDQRSVQEMFQQYGSVAGCKLLDNAEKGQSAALVRFKSVKDAKKIKEKLDKGTVEGSSVPISIEFAVEKRKMLQKKAEEAAKKEAEEKKDKKSKQDESDEEPEETKKPKAEEQKQTKKKKSDSSEDEDDKEDKKKPKVEDQKQKKQKTSDSDDEKETEA